MSNLVEALDAAIERMLQRRKLDRLDPLERRLEAYLMAAYARMEAQFYRAGPEWLQEAEPGPTEWVDGLWFQVQLNDEYLERFMARAQLYGQRDALRDLALPVAFRLPNPLAQLHLARYGADLVTHITDTVRSELKDVLFRARLQGWSYDVTAKVMKEKWAQFRVAAPQQHIRSRAHLIAVTETGAAYEAGNSEVRRELEREGWVMEKSWLVVGDDRTCMICAGNSMAGWIPNSASFPSGGANPPGHPACRCTAIPRTVERLPLVATVV